MVSTNQNKEPRRPSPWDILGIIVTIEAGLYYFFGDSVIELIRQLLAAFGL